MKNNFQSNGKGRSQRVWQLLISMLIILTMGIGQMWGASGTIPAANATDLGSGKTPRYVVEQAGVGRLMKNKTGSSNWTVSSGALQTGSSMFALQTYNAISEIVIYGKGTGNNRTLSKVEVGTATDDYAEITGVSVTVAGTDDGKFTSSSNADSMHIVTDIAKDSYVAITFSGNVNITSVKFIYAGASYTVTYALGDGTGTTPTESAKTAGAKFTLHNGTTGITAPSGKKFGGWNDGTTTYNGGAEYTMGTSNVTLTAQWVEDVPDPTATFTGATYIIGASALDMSAKFSSNSSGAVTYTLKEATTDASITSDGSFTATAEGEYVVVANQEAVAGNYAAISKEATVTVLDSEISDTYVWKKGSGYTGCVTSPNADAPAAKYTTVTVEGMASMASGRASTANTTVTVTIAATQEGFAIKNICTYGKLEEAEGAEISWDGGSNWMALAAYSETKKDFAAPAGYPTSFKIKFISASTSSGGLWWRNAFVTLEVIKPISGTTEVLQDVEVNGTSIAAVDLASLKENKSLAITTAYTAAPTVTFVKRTTTNYVGWPSTYVDAEEDVVATDATTNWSATSSAIDAQTYTVTLAKPAGPSLESATTELTLSSAKIAMDEKNFTFSGSNLEGNVTIALESTVAGMTVSPAEVTPTAGAITDQEVTVTYKSLENVAEANVNLIIRYNDDTKIIIPLTYSSTEGYEELTSISAATTWNWTNANSAERGTINDNAIVVLANMEGWVDAFNARAIAGRLQYYYRGNKYAQGHNLKFNTTVPGKVSVKYSNTGEKSIARAPRITDSNGTYAPTSGSTNSNDAQTFTYDHLVAAGEVFIEGFEIKEPIALNMLRFYEVKFLPTHTLSFADGGTIADMTVAEGEDAVLPEVAAADVPEGKSFKGWYDGDNKVGDAGDAYTMGTSDKTLTAKYQTLCTTPTIAWATAPANSKSLSGTQDVGVTLTGYAGAITWISSDENVATISGSDENATITYVGEGTTTITAKFVIPEEQALCEGTYQVTKEITLQDCPEPAALQYEIARFQVPGCGIDHNNALTNADVARDNCTVTVSNGVGGSSSNWYQNTTNNLWYAKFQSAGEVVLKVDGGFQEGDIVHVYMRAVNGNGLKLKKSEVEIKTTQNGNAEVDLEYEVLSADIEDDGSLDFVRVSSNTYINRIVVVRPPCRTPSIAWATEPAKKVHVGDADGTATITSNYVAGVTYTSSNPAVATVSGNGTSTVTIHYVADGTTTITASVAGSGDPGDNFCTDPVSVSKEIRVIGAAPASGTLYKFNVKTLASGVYLFDTYPASMEMTTENYLSELDGGELTASVTGNAQRLFIDNSGYGSMSAFVFSGGAGGLLTLNLDYQLAAGDIIKYQVISGTSDKLKLSDAANADNNTLLVGTGNTNVQTFEVPAAWAGATILKIERSNNSPRIPYFEVVRPAKYAVSFDMMGHGTQIADIENVLDGHKITAPTAPTDEDYGFAGWYKENTLENEWDFDNDVVTADTTLYAKWLDKSDATLKSLMYGSEEITLENAVFEYYVDLAPYITDVPALTAVTNNPNATATPTNADAFDGNGHATSIVTVTPEKEGAAPQIYTVYFTVLPDYARVDVTATTEWDFSKALVDNTKNATLSSTETVLANITNVKNHPVDFHSQALSVKVARIDKNGFMQGGTIKFRTTVPGLLTVEFSNTGNAPRPYRELLVNGIPTGAKSNNQTHVTYNVVLKSGDVELTARIYDEDGNPTATLTNVNIFNVKFTAREDMNPVEAEASTLGGYERDVTEGRYGTICLPKAGVMVGAAIYELAYYSDSENKIFMDQVINGEMIAGRPYIFLPNESVSTLGVYYTDDEVVAAGDYRGLYGFYDNSGEPMQLYPGDGHYILFNNQFREVTDSYVYIDQNRAYFKIGVSGGIPTTPSAPLPNRRRVVMSGYSTNSATGMENAEASEAPVKMMIDGQLFILRGEKLYDATGRLVK